MKKLLLSILFLAGSAGTFAQLKFQENFNYTLADNVGGNCSSGTCSNNNWITFNGTTADATVFNVSSGSLSYANFPIASGNKISLPNGAVRDIGRQILTAGNVIYASFLINIPTNTGLNGTIGDTNTFFHFGNGTFSNFAVGGVLCRLSIRKNATTFSLGIQNNNNIEGSGMVAYSASGDLTYGQTYLIVVKYDNSVPVNINTPSTYHVASLWINPASSSFNSTEPTPTLTNSSGSNTFANAVQSIILRTSAQTPIADFDELRVGTTWASVTTESTLPVTLTSFIAKAVDKNIVLKWVTASEQNSASFNILRSLDGKQFFKIGEVNAMGNSKSVTNYTFTDDAPYAGNNYYKLEQVDIDGSKDFSEIIVAKFNLQKSSLVAYSASSGVNLNIYADVASKSNIHLFSLSGQKISETNVSLNKGYNNFDIKADLQPGVYVVKLLLNGNLLYNKFIK